MFSSATNTCVTLNTENVCKGREKKLYMQVIAQNSAKKITLVPLPPFFKPSTLFFML